MENFAGSYGTAVQVVSIIILLFFSYKLSNSMVNNILKNIFKNKLDDLEEKRERLRRKRMNEFEENISLMRRMERPKSWIKKLF